MEGDKPAVINTYLFDYNSISDSWFTEQKCCKKYRKKGKSSCKTCPNFYHD